MNNIKSIAVARDGNAMRIAATYDVINDEGTVIENNKRLNRIVTDQTVLDAINVLEDYVQDIIDAENE